VSEKHLPLLTPLQSFWMLLSQVLVEVVHNSDPEEEGVTTHISILITLIFHSSPSL